MVQCFMTLNIETQKCPCLFFLNVAVTFFLLHFICTLILFFPPSFSYLPLLSIGLHTYRKGKHEKLLMTKYVSLIFFVTSSQLVSCSSCLLVPKLMALFMTRLQHSSVCTVRYFYCLIINCLVVEKLSI